VVSIIITLYNYEKYITDCLESCLNQTYNDYEIIVVDDKSTDDGAHIVWQYKIRHSKKVKLLSHHKNMGIAKAKNTGVKASMGEIITFIDADDCLTVDSIEKRVKAFQKRPELEFVHGFAYSVKGNLTYDECLRRKFRIHGRKDRVHAQTTMYRRRVFEKYGLFFPIHSKEDKEMTYRLGLHPLSPLPKLVKSKKIKDICAYYRIHGDSAKHSRTEKEAKKLKQKFDERIKQLKKEGITKENTKWL